MNILLAQETAFTAPDIEWVPLIPLIVVLGGAVVGVLIEAFASPRLRRPINVVWTLFVLAAGFVLSSGQWFLAEMQVIEVGEYVSDTLTVSMQMMVTLLAFLSVLVMADRSMVKDGAFAAQPSDRPGSGEESLSLAKGYQRSEIYPLVLFSVGGMMLFPASDSLLTMFVALEVMSLPLYILVATSRRRRYLSQEAAIKYFILGSFASAFFLMGAALLYGYGGVLLSQLGGEASLRLRDIAVSLPIVNEMDWMLLLAVFMIMVGLLFKVAVFPFHEWTPDVYTGAPTPITGFMAAGVKVAAFGALLRVYTVIVAPLKWDFYMILAVLAALTIVFGTVGGLVQKNIKRLLAYSSVAHAGFIMIGVVALNIFTYDAVAFYLLAYGLATVGAFAVITQVRRVSPQGDVEGEANLVDQWAGLGKRSPGLAFAMLIFLMSFAGIPLTSGFVAKFVVFAAGIQGGLGWLVAIALAASVATAAVYFRVVQIMFFREPAEGVEVVQSEGPTSVVVFFTAAATILLGIFPGPVLDFFAGIAVAGL